MTHNTRVSFRLGTVAVPLLVAAMLIWAAGLDPRRLFAQSPDPCEAPVTNPVACENTLPGNPASEWDISGAGSPTIQGFATDISVNRGGTVRFKVDTAAVAYRLDVYRLGYYGGAGARQVATVAPSASLPQPQPACVADNGTGLFDCGVWAESASWTVPPSAVSGIYIAKLVRTDGVPGSSHIVFVVRDDTGQSALLFQTSDTTWQAYNPYGGNSLYVGAPAGRAYKVSYNRPFTTRESSPADWLFNAEYPMLRWLEANGYNVSYTTGVDTDRRAAELLEHKVFLSVGHDEYWSGAQRANVEAARDAGVHLAFMSGNEVFWKTRYEPSIDGSATAYRTLVSYKETHANGKIDPLTNVWTGTWRDPRFSPPADGGRPENALIGTMFMVNVPGSPSDAIQVPEAMGKLRLWRNTSVATLAPGAVATLSAGTLGYEWDEAVVNAARPTGLMRLSSTSIAGASKLQDYGSSYAPGTATHSLTVYRHPTSNALVFGAGTVQWSWGLDGVHDRGGSVPDVRMQQAMVNLFADMGVQPFAVGSGLTAASASSDTTVPTAAIAFPAGGATVMLGVSTLMSGNASDVGGVVAGVEISTDGGTTWSPATGTSPWTFAWTPSVLGSATLLARAVDDSGNIGTGSAVTINVAATLPSSCPCTLWPDTTVPPLADAGADAPLELGVKFRATQDGFISGIRFYKSAANTGTHIGNLWRTNGTLLGTVIFANETASGWQTASFTTPVAVTANTTYVASYHLNNGHYAFSPNYFGSAGVTSGSLQAPANTETQNGVYQYNVNSAFPGQSYNATNYWVDVVFDTGTQDTTPPAVTSVTPAPGSNGADINAVVVAAFSEAIDVSTIGSSTFTLRDAGNNAVAAVVTYDSGTRSATLDPNAALTLGTTYTATIRGGAVDPRVKDAAGNAMAADFTWSFTVPADNTLPTVISVLPSASATGVSAAATVRATFSEAMDPTTITGNTVTLRTASSALVAAGVTYDAGTRTAILTPTAPLAAASVYTATVKGGGTDPRAKDLAGNALAADVSWAFTTASAAPTGCPCTIWGPSVTPANIDGGDASAVELGVKFQADSDGFITGIRFYKAAANGGTHVGRLWTTAGTQLGTVTFTSETGSGWQQATFATPIEITANTVYVASYFAPQGHYSFNSNYFVSAVNNAPLRALANGVSSNGVYRYGSSGFPNQTYNAANYWVDVVYGATPVAVDTTPPSVAGVSPMNGGSGIGINTSLSATFSEPLDEATVGTTTFEIRSPANALVPATVTWNASTRMTILQPTAPLLNSTTYTVRVKGGPTDPRVKDVAGNAMTSDFVWSFTTGAAAAQSPAQGPGGPILVVTSPSNPFGTYYAEILRAEGLNEFAMADLSTVSAATLGAYDVVILSQLALNPAQVAMFSDWSNAGGNLITMRPDKQLAGLLGLTDLGTTLSDKYLLVDTSAAPGLGIVAESMQFHGTADRYALSGATSVATLYSTSVTPTSSPALALRTLAGAGGMVATFTYDLARSVVYTRQGNPAWSGQERDGLDPRRSNDLFFGAAAGDPQPDWVDFNKITIPQADEQQRLLANLILHMNLRKKPLPRFWYLPRGLKAAIVMTGDDHGAYGGTQGRFDAHKLASTPGCSVDDWECIRSTSYIWSEVSTMTNAQAAQYVADGFEIGPHVNAGCNNYTPTTLGTVYDQQMAGFASRLPGAGLPTTHRLHCIVWSDYDSQAQIEAARGIRLDTNYYYWPGEWVQDRPGLFTGSGLPMRFAKSDGTIIDIYQAPTQMPDETNQTQPLTVNALLDKALGPEGFYGTFVTNMHTDYAAHAASQAIIGVAQNRGVPVISSKQLLTWLDARNASSFGGLTWTSVSGAPQGGRTLSFTVSEVAGTNGLEAMLPLRLVGGSGLVTSVARSGAPVIFEIRTVKGVEYAVFRATGGSYAVSYDTTPPDTTFTATPAGLVNTTGATFQFTATELGATFQCRLDGAAFAACSAPVTVSGLTTGAHTFQVRATDAAGNTDATAASYAWSVDVTAPGIAGRTPASGALGVSTGTPVTVVFSEPVAAATVNASTIRIRQAGAGSDLAATVSLGGNTVTLQPSTPLLLGGQFQVTVAGTVTDVAGNPLGADSVWTFSTSSSLSDTTTADFALGTLDANGRLSQLSNGEVMLAATDGGDFSGTTLPSGWSGAQWTSGGATTVSGGSLSVNGMRVSPAASYTPGRSLEFMATFGSDGYQHVGFGLTFNETPWAIFSTFSGSGLYVRTNNGTGQTDTPIAGNWLNAPHRFRIDWNASSVVYSIDGTTVATHPITISVNMRPIVSDYLAGGSTVSVDWLRLTPYATPSVFTSRVFDASAPVSWTTANWTADLPAGTSVVVRVRTGNTAVPDGSWSAFTTIGSPGGAISLTSRYIQYELQLSSTGTGQTPVVRDVTLTAAIQ